VRTRIPSLRLFSTIFLIPTLFTACVNPNAVGVQDYGTIVGRVYDAQTNQPLNNVIVSVGSLITAHSGPDGSFSLTQVPTGQQTITIYAPPGYLSPAPVSAEVQKDQTTAVPAIGITPAS
jgi:Carboxypeptidase regulatory-like domain